jgi:hypothetical protein
MHLRGESEAQKYPAKGEELAPVASSAEAKGGASRLEHLLVAGGEEVVQGDVLLPSHLTRAARKGTERVRRARGHETVVGGRERGMGHGGGGPRSIAPGHGGPCGGG